MTAPPMKTFESGFPPVQVTSTPAERVIDRLASALVQTKLSGKVSETEKVRGPIKAGFFADLIAVPGDPLQNIDALKNVQFVMKDGQVFKKDGIMTPAAFFQGGPVNGWRIR